MKTTLPLTCLSLLVPALLAPSPALGRDQISVGFSVTSGPAWGNRSCGPRIRSYGPHYAYGSYGYSYGRGAYPIYAVPCPPPVVVVPRSPVVSYAPYSPAPYYAPPAYVVPPTSVVQVQAGDSTVLQVQSALRQRKYYRGALDGLNGPETRAAIRAYQVDRGLPVTGQMDSDLLAELLR
jgi:hypothetical protein